MLRSNKIFYNVQVLECVYVILLFFELFVTFVGVSFLEAILEPC